MNDCSNSSDSIGTQPNFKLPVGMGGQMGTEGETLCFEKISINTEKKQESSSSLQKKGK